MSIEELLKLLPSGSKKYINGFILGVEAKLLCTCGSHVITEIDFENSCFHHIQNCCESYCDGTHHCFYVDGLRFNICREEDWTNFNYMLSELPCFDTSEFRLILYEISQIVSM